MSLLLVQSCGNIEGATFSTPVFFQCIYIRLKSRSTRTYFSASLFFKRSLKSSPETEANLTSPEAAILLLIKLQLHSLYKQQWALLTCVWEPAKLFLKCPDEGKSKAILLSFGYFFSQKAYNTMIYFYHWRPDTNNVFFFNKGIRPTSLH